MGEPNTRITFEFTSQAAYEQGGNFADRYAIGNARDMLTFLRNKYPHEDVRLVKVERDRSVRPQWEEVPL